MLNKKLKTISVIQIACLIAIRVLPKYWSTMRMKVNYQSLSENELGIKYCSDFYCGKHDNEMLFLWKKKSLS